MTDFEPVRVLVVHTDAADLAVVASVVAAHDYTLRGLDASQSLVDEVERYRPDAVVLDVKQHTSDGYALCRAVKSVAPVVPVILVGSNDVPEVRQRAFAAGCDDFLGKPVNRQLLAYRLRSYARLRRAWSAATRPILNALRRFVESHGDDSSSRAEALEILRRDIGVEADLLAALETWMGNLEQDAHEIET